MDPRAGERAIHPYGRGRSQVGELFLPGGGASAPRGGDGLGAPASGPWPVAVLLHGGYWRARYGRSLMEGLCIDLAARGWAAWNLEYRRLGVLSGGGWPETFLDVSTGIDHLAQLRDGGCPLDLDRVVAIGHSAGGQLALWAAARDRLPGDGPGAAPRVPVTHAVTQGGVNDLVEGSRLRLSNGVVDRLLGGSPERRPERYELASPRARLPLGVPQLVVHGADDDTVPVSLGRDYARAAREAGDDVELVELPGTGHFEHIDPSSAAWAAVAEWLP